jgi:hypothetical protein
MFHAFHLLTEKERLWDGHLKQRVSDIFKILANSHLITLSPYIDSNTAAIQVKCEDCMKERRNLRERTVGLTDDRQINRQAHSNRR